VKMPRDIPEQQQHLLQDAILFASNAQHPHIIKNMILFGVCALFFFLAPRVCGAREVRSKPQETVNRG